MEGVGGSSQHYIFPLWAVCYVRLAASLASGFISLATMPAQLNRSGQGKCHLSTCQAERLRDASGCDEISGSCSTESRPRPPSLVSRPERPSRSFGSMTLAHSGAARDLCRLVITAWCKSHLEMDDLQARRCSAAVFLISAGGCIETEDIGQSARGCSRSGGSRAEPFDAFPKTNEA